MKRVRVLFAVLTVTVLGIGNVQAVEKPAVLDDALVSIAVSDLHGLIDGVGSVASQIQPMMNGDMLKAALGMQIGDPTLSGIPAGKGLAVVMLDATNYFAVAEVAAAQLATYTNMVTSMGMQVTVTNGLMVVATDAAQLEKGAGLAKKVQSTLLSKRSASLRLAAHPAVYLGKNKEQVDGMLEMIPMLIGMQSAQTTTPESAEVVAQILEGELRVLASVASQLETYELELVPAGGSIGLNETIIPTKGSRFATLVNAPVVNEYNPKIQSGMMGQGAVQIDLCFLNAPAVMDFIDAEIMQCVTDMELDGELVKGLMDYKKKWLNVFGGTVAESILNGTNGVIAADYVIEINDEKAALDLWKTLSADMEKAGVYALYKKMGVPMTFEFKEAVREHNGIAVHQLKMNISYEMMPEEQKAQMESMLGDLTFDVALHDGMMVYSMGGQLDALLDRLKESAPEIAPLAARKQFKKGGFYYFDFNVDKYLAFAATLVPDDPEFIMLASLMKGADPITSAGYRENGVFQSKTSIPGSFITKVGQAVMMMQMQQAQQQSQPAPAPAPAE